MCVDFSLKRNSSKKTKMLSNKQVNKWITFRFYWHKTRLVNFPRKFKELRKGNRNKQDLWTSAFPELIVASRKPTNLRTRHHHVGPTGGKKRPHQLWGLVLLLAIVSSPFQKSCRLPALGCRAGSFCLTFFSLRRLSVFPKEGPISPFQQVLSWQVFITAIKNENQELPFTACSCYRFIS